ncbi:DUF4188 domain-containing protein [Vallicoccus soli]|uniref:DUF4188 domain-containing protein n=2 Tax=Vallicoccus soli TaxID=2339232 RepID=A0A3A3ZHX2_9ACTN|nr:DUF4188 domain-containing protein [Vallicoccus soli]
MRINRWTRPWNWGPVFAAMPRMLAELARADRGMLGARTFWSGRVVLVVQHWRSEDELRAYARSADAEHLPAWRRFNRRARATGDVGVFHETYRVDAADVESVYVSMEPVLLGAATGGRVVG